MTGTGTWPEMGAFDVCGPLPTGTTVLEASAGTGKTYTVGALVARFVAEGHASLDQLLVVTFGRAASQELRERVRGQLVAAERALADPAAARAGDDSLVALLASAPDAEVSVRRRRLATALADFDAATIVTTHQFCQQVLTGLGVAGDSEPGATLVDDLDDLVVEVVDDLYLRRFAAPGAPAPAFDRRLALQLGRTAVNDPQARLEPAEAATVEPDGQAAWRWRFATAVRHEVDRRKRRRRLLGYDDLLSLLAGALQGDDAPARDRVRARWRIVLVDEFQDTDPVQWQVLERAFAGHSTLVLIGDPKQAIYAFRGGDVSTYLAAAGTAGVRATLSTNYRSDAPLVASLQALLGGAALGDPGIVVRLVDAAHGQARLTGAPSTAPVRLRVVTRGMTGDHTSATLRVPVVRPAVVADLAADVAGLLGAGASFDGSPLAAGDVAVLVGTHAQAAMVRTALAAVGVPAVVAGGGSVFATRASDDWMVLLEALEQPHRSARVRAAALTAFLGRTAVDLAAGEDGLTDELGSLLRTWADLLQRRGVAALLEVATAEQQLSARLLRLPDGERRLTDLRHVGESLHTAAVAGGLGLAALVEWLRERRAEAAGDTSVERTRRLDSDAAAVQVVTLHASKGMQYPVVYLPFAFDRWVRDADLLLLHDDQGRRVLDVGGAQSPGRAARERRAASEDAGESLRLLYVGLTRAQSQVVTWWAPTTNTPTSPLHRVLLGRTAGESAVPDSAALPEDEVAAQRFAALQEAGALVVEAASPRPGGSPEPAPQDASRPLDIGRLGRVLDTSWRRTSYTALTSVEDHGAAPGVGSEPETGEREDEDVDVVPDLDDPADVAAVQSALRAVRSPMAELPQGAAFGTLVHAVLETVDPQADDLAAELLRCAAEQLARRPSGTLGVGRLAEALVPVLTSPLGPVGADLTLADVRVADRLAELDFELPLGGGDRPGAHRHATLADVADLLERHLRPDDPLAGYPPRLRTPELGWQSLRGYLTGSLDVVLRLPGPRFVVADYKTNWLGDPGEELTAWHYRPEALTTAMTHSHYPLQALLYGVALHRYLRWRQPGYDPDRHLGGVLYLYLRGMCGPDTPVVDGSPCGVFGWQPPPGLVPDLSDLLDGPATGGRT